MTRKITFPVEASHIMMFARAIGETNPAYLDAEAARATENGGIIAPPTFATCVTQFDPDPELRPTPGHAWYGSGRTASGAPPPGGTELHAEQHYEYHRPLRPGDVLEVERKEGKTWTKEGRRGTLHFKERIVEYRDKRTSELVMTARAVGVRVESKG